MIKIIKGGVGGNQENFSHVLLFELEKFSYGILGKVEIRERQVFVSMENSALCTCALVFPYRESEREGIIVW